MMTFCCFWRRKRDNCSCATNPRTEHACPNAL